MQRNLEGVCRSLIGSFTSERQSVDGIKARGALQGIQESDHAAVVATDGGIDGDFHHSTAGNFGLLVRAVLETDARFPRQVIELGLNRGISRTRGNERVLEGIAILLDRGDVVADFLSIIDAFFQQIVLLCLRGQYRFGRLWRRGEVPTVTRKGNVREDKKTQPAEDHAPAN